MNLLFIFILKVPNSQEKHDMVGRPKIHASAYKQAAGNKFIIYGFCVVNWNFIFTYR